MQGWKFFPERPQGPVDGAYVQHRPVRAYRVGALRWMLVIALSLLTAYLAFVGLAVSFSGRSITDVAVAALLALVVVGGLAVLTTRLLATGVWVDDHGLRALTVLSARRWEWPEVVDVRVVPQPVRVLGTPLRRSGHAVMLVLADGADAALPLTDLGLDFLGRTEAFDIAAGTVERWFEETRRPPG